MSLLGHEGHFAAKGASHSTTCDLDPQSADIIHARFGHGPWDSCDVHYATPYQHDHFPVPLPIPLPPDPVQDYSVINFTIPK